MFEPAKGALGGEASTWYLHSGVAIPRILELNQTARIIALVRNPIDLAISWHAQRLYAFAEDVRSFEMAWRLQDARRAGRLLPPHCIEPDLLMYGDIAKCGVLLQRALRVVPAKQMKVIVFDDLVGG